MLDSFLTFINQLNLDLTHQSTILTVSSGVDSVVMVDLFHKAGFKATIAHCNFGLRGEESEEDERFVKDLARSYGFSFLVKRFETKQYAYEKGISTQMAARDLRYAWFEKERIERHDWIATAHHANDAIETILLNLARGTGIAGLNGIHAINGNLIRPLLFATKEEIVEYAQLHALAWREDRSNASLDYRRNLIRAKVYPVLKEMNPSLEKTFKNTFEKIGSAQTILKESLRQYYSKIVEKKGEQLFISIPELLKVPEPTYVLWSILDDYGFNYESSKQIMSTTEFISGSTFFSSNYQLLRDRETFILRERDREKGNVVLEINGEGFFENGEEYYEVSIEEIAESFNIEANPEWAYLDAEKVSFPMTVRSWQAGDTFRPFGMKGQSKRVSDILINKKLTLFEKEKVKVMMDAKRNILWLIGIRIDDRACITVETQRVIVIKRRQKGR